MRRHLLLAVSVLGMVGHFISAAHAQSGSFQINNQFITGLSSPTAMAFAPDGRLFITQQAGAIRVVTAAGQLLTTPFHTIGVRSDEERGLLGLAFHPQFASNGYIYIFYSPNNAAVTRVSRLTANGNVVVAGSEVTVFEYGNFSGNHRGGDIHFGLDGKLYIALGDAGEPTNSQSLTSFDGKILRLNPDGSVPADNPTTFVTTSGATVTTSGQYRAIWAMGLRNPYRFSFNEAGAMRINDVGAGLWEEVNVGQAGVNYGWPTCEGMCSNAYARNPIYVHERGDEGCAITGGAFHRGNQFPTTYADNYFLVDYCSTWLRHLRTDNSEATFPLSVPQFSVDLKFAPDGSLYILGHGSGTISRITYFSSGTNRNPTAQLTATPQSGQAPLTVSFNASGSTDPDGDPLTYSWQFGDGTTASGVSVSHTYAGAGSYSARVTVSDGRGGSDFRQVTIAVGTPPTASITTPSAGTLYTAGQTISFSGTASDAEDGPLPGSAFSWTVQFHHDAHTHPALGPLNGATSGSFTIPVTGHTEDTVFYRIYLTVTDSSGVQTLVTRDVNPRKARITLASNVAGAQILLDGQPQVSPYTFTGVVGVQRTIDVTSPQSVAGQTYGFQSWSDGGARSHVITTPASDTTYTATLVAQSGTPAPPAAAHWRFDNNLTESVNATNTAGRGTIAYSSDTAPVGANPAALQLDGSTESYVAVAGEGVFNGWTAASTSLWIKVSSATAASWAIGSQHTLLFKTGAIQARLVKDSAGQLRFVVTHGNGVSLGNQITSTRVVATDAWVHLVSVHSGTTATLYVGSQAAGAGDTGRIFGGTNTGTLDIVGHGGNYLGLLDDLRLFDTALSGAQVTALTGMPPAPPTGLRIIR